MAAIQDAIASEEGPVRCARNQRLGQAVHRHRPTSRQGIQERLFTLAFSGLVYPQIWEDPVVDLEALKLRGGEELIAIASGGCNVLSYLAAAPVSITAVDLNPAHVALNNLKVAALEHLPDYAAFCRFFAEADARQNIDAYFTYLKPHLDAATRRYWESRDRLGRLRIGYFGRNVYRHGLLGGFIGAGHLFARLHGANPRRLLSAKSRTEQRRLFERELAPLFAKRHIRWFLDKPFALFGLGIPPAQFNALKGSEARMANVLRAPGTSCLRFRSFRQLFRLVGLWAALLERWERPAAALSTARKLCGATLAHRRRRRCARLVHRASGPKAGRLYGRLRAARCAGLDDGRTA